MSENIWKIKDIEFKTMEDKQKNKINKHKRKKKVLIRPIIKKLKQLEKFFGFESKELKDKKF